MISQGVQGSFASIASAFVIESLEHMIPWLFVMFAIIITDLAFGVRKSISMGQQVRFSRAVRATMGKMVTYFAFVCMVCMVNVAMGGNSKVEVYSCLLVCFIEGCSIFGNILKPKGIDFNFLGALRLLAKKATRVNGEEINEIIKKEGNNEERRD